MEITIGSISDKKKITPNEKQMECIKTLNGSVMVLAGPGTGKTFTIIQRIKYMLEQAIQPESILCLTFSEAAANEMKIRLIKEIGTIASSVVIHTYHAFCNELIRQYPSEFELLEGVSLIDDITKRNLMKECITQYNPKFYRTKWGNAEYYVPELISAVDEIKKNQVTKEEYFETLNTHAEWQGKLDELNAEYAEREKKGKLVKTFLGGFEAHKKKMGKAQEAWEIYEIYNQKLKENNFIDFNDMINLVLQTFENNEDFLKKVASTYEYFLVDEYQDTNFSQNQIVFKLASANCSESVNTPNIFVVGDDDQIIYGFQGAQTDNLEKFLLRYPNTKVLCLNENNRSTQPVLDLSYKIISQDLTRLEINPEFKKYNINKKLMAKNSGIIEKTSKISLHSFGDIKQENNFIVEEVEQLYKNNVELSQIAILTRQNNELMEFANLLKAKNIPYQIKLTKSIFELKASIITYFYLKALENNQFYADKLFGLLLSKPFDFDRGDYHFLLDQYKLNEKDFITNIRKNLDRDWNDSEKVHNFIKVYDELQEVKSCEKLRNLVVEIINRTGILAYFVNSPINRVENILALKRIVEEAASCQNINPTATVFDFINHLDSAFKDDIAISIDADNYVQNAVQLLTLHGSKGCEFEYVYLPNLIAKSWEKKRVSNKMTLPIEKTQFSGTDDEAKKAEQLRLLFVGISRAKHGLTLSFSNMINNKTQELTSYLTCICEDENLVERYTHELNSETYTEELIKSMSSENFDYKTVFKEHIKSKLKDFVMSPSTLNAYLGCPRSFLYSVILDIPVFEGEWDAANYGSAVHKTLEWAIVKAKEDKSYPNKKQFQDEFIRQLSLQKFPDLATREEYEKRGIESLSKYYPKFVEIPPEYVYKTEYRLDLVPIENRLVKGFIDRIEINPETASYCVYDYKTGSAKAKSQIADGKDYEGYYNQLRFYKLAFETQNVGAKVTQAGLLFVEDPEGSYFTKLTDEDNELIKEKILSTYEKIDNLEFEPVEQCEKNCKFCGYKQLCNLNVL